MSNKTKSNQIPQTTKQIKKNYITKKAEEKDRQVEGQVGGWADKPTETDSQVAFLVVAAFSSRARIWGGGEVRLIIPRLPFFFFLSGDQSAVWCPSRERESGK